MNFDLFMPVQLITGRGCIRENASEFAKLGRKCLIVTSGSAAKKSGALADVTAALGDCDIPWTVFDRVQQNPLLTDSYDAGRMAREFGAEFVVGIGGGSPLDTAKAAAVFAVNDMEPMDIYKLDWPNRALPLILVGTTAGTGSEVAPFSVLTKPDGRKKSFASDQVYGRIAFGDPGYTDSLPRRFTVSTALDALSHALEGYYSTAASAISDLFAVEAVRILHPALGELRDLAEGAAVPKELRDRLYYASVLAGITLAKCGTCYCHCLGYFLSEEHGVPHGTACAVYLPDFLRRQGAQLPAKAVELWRHAGCTEREITALIESLLELPEIRLTAAEIDEIVERNVSTGNFVRTAPSGYTAGEARKLLAELYTG